MITLFRGAYKNLADEDACGVGCCLNMLNLGVCWVCVPNPIACGVKFGVVTVAEPEGPEGPEGWNTGHSRAIVHVFLARQKILGGSHGVGLGAGV